MKKNEEIEKAIYSLVDKVNTKNYTKMYKELDNLLLSYRGRFSKEEVVLTLFCVYWDYPEEKEYEWGEEVLIDACHRFIGQCSPSDEIDWDTEKNREIRLKINAFSLDYKKE